MTGVEIPQKGKESEIFIHPSYIVLVAVLIYISTYGSASMHLEVPEQHEQYISLDFKVC